MIRPLFASSLLSLLVLSGCQSGQKTGVHLSSVHASSDPAYKIYKLHGKVVSIDAAKGEVTLDHDAIPGFMEAMIMPYKLKDISILNQLHPGDVVSADVLVSKDSDADLLLDHIVVVVRGSGVG